MLKKNSAKLEDQPVYLYRKNRDGSLATVVRRKDVPLVSIANLVLSRPKLPDLDCNDASEASHTASRELVFQYPYKDFHSLISSPVRSPKVLQPSIHPSHSRPFLSPRTSLRDKNLEIVEKLELSRQNFDVLERRRWRTEAPSPLQLKAGFAIQPISMPPTYCESAIQIKVMRRKKNELGGGKEVLKDLGFEDDDGEIERKLKSLEKTEEKRGRGVEQKEKIVPAGLVRYDPKLYEERGRRLTKAEALRQEASQYLQEEFRQRLAAGYVSQLQYGSALVKEPMALRFYKGLELV